MASHHLLDQSLKMSTSAQLDRVSGVSVGDSAQSTGSSSSATSCCLLMMMLMMRRMMYCLVTLMKLVRRMMTVRKWEGVRVVGGIHSFSHYVVCPETPSPALVSTNAHLARIHPCLAALPRSPLLPLMCTLQIMTCPLHPSLQPFRLALYVLMHQPLISHHLPCCTALAGIACDLTLSQILVQCHQQITPLHRARPHLCLKHLALGAFGSTLARSSYSLLLLCLPHLHRCLHLLIRLASGSHPTLTNLIASICSCNS